MKRTVAVAWLALALACGGSGVPADDLPGTADLSGPRDTPIDPVDPGDLPAPRDLPRDGTDPLEGDDAPGPADLPDATDVPEPADLPDATDAPVPADAPDATDAPDPADVPPADAGPDTATPAPLFDLPAIRDAADADCRFESPRTTLKDGVLVEVFQVSYRSWESIDGVLKPIRIRGFAARPAGSGVVPGIVQAHGLGGYSEESHATGGAASWKAFVLAYTGPGGGTVPGNTSEGRAAGYDEGRRMFDTIPDPRGSWFWGHAVAAMRGLTCLAARSDVDASRLGMTGFSAGGVATQTVAAVDDRVKAAVPLSGTGAWDVATRSPGAWQHALLTKAGLSTASPEWLRLIETIDARTLAPGTKAAVLMVNGTTDEFFPLTAWRATWDALPAGLERRASLAANFDHGCYALTGLEDAKDIEDRAAVHASGGQAMWFGHFLTGDAAFAYIPVTPEVQISATPAGSLVVAAVDGGGAALEVADVTLWASGDACFFFGGAKLQKNSGIWEAIVPVAPTPDTVWYVDVTYKVKSLLDGRRFALSSLPALPADLVPRIRAVDTCQ